MAECSVHDAARRSMVARCVILLCRCQARSHAGRSGRGFAGVTQDGRMWVQCGRLAPDATTLTALVMLIAGVLLGHNVLGDLSVGDLLGYLAHGQL